MLLGSLTRHLASNDLLFPRPEAPFSGWSFDDVAKCARKTPSTQMSVHQGMTVPDQCKMASHIEPIVRSIEDNLRGLSITEFGGSR